MRRLAIFTMLGFGLLLIAVATSAGDSQPASDPVEPTGMATSEPATEPLGTDPRLAPFSPYDVGPTGGVWRYESVSPADKAIVDRARTAGEAAARQRVNDVYAGAAAEAFDKSVAALAQARLGLEGLEDLGVVGGITGDTPGGVPPGSGPGGGGGTRGGGGTGGGRGHGTGGGGGS